MKWMGYRKVVVFCGAILLLGATGSFGLTEERYRSTTSAKSGSGEHAAASASKTTIVKASATAAKTDSHTAAPAAHATTDADGAHAAIQMQPNQALNKLLEGNARYVSGKTQGPNRSVARRTEQAKGQRPFAIVIACSDSRVPPEILFDQGIGDIFVIRTAGNVVDDIALGSIEYAVEHLGANLIVVLGHKSCGAVTAAVAGGTAPGHVGSIVAKITPAVEKARAKQGGDLVDNAIRANIKEVGQTVRGSEPILRELMDDGAVRVVGAYYDLESGVVTTTYSPCIM